MWKPLARSVITEVVHRLPPAAKRVLLHALSADVAADTAYEVLQALGRSFGITDIRVLGDYGLVEGALADSSILATYARTRRWAAGTNRIVDAFFDRHERGTYIDVGANIGLTTIPIARRGAVACKAFEPEPATFRYLTRNVHQNCAAGNVETYNLALYDQRGSVAFELADDNFGDHRIRRVDHDGSFGEARRRVITVPAERLDDVVNAAQLAPPVVVKIDTQGAECHVLCGGRAVLAAAALVAFEFWPYGLRRLGGDPDTLATFIATTFSRGAVLAGDVDATPVWRPISVIAAWLRDFASQRRDAAYAYCDVIVAQ
ncbi:MAG TPA: FkbM family methyltransferase [Stellaceae bacterium]|nr:FkbM family methyltransferase [Stellaceae bacterium]